MKRGQVKRKIARAAVSIVWMSFAMGVMSLRAQGGPIPISPNMADKEPKDLRPNWTDTLGVPAPAVQLDASTMDSRIQINRVVSYEVDDTGKLDPQGNFTGVVSNNAKLIVWACITTDDPKAIGIPLHINLLKLNDLALSKTLTCNLVSANDCAREIGFHQLKTLVPTTIVHFGQATFDPLASNLTWRFHNLSTPTPGMNDLNWQVSVDPQNDGRTGRITVHLFPYLQFEAIAPIIMVHGTAAHSDSWEHPAYHAETFNGIYGLVEPFVSPIVGQGLGFFVLHHLQDPSGTNPPMPPVPWFFGINLGTVYKPDGVTIDFDKSGNSSIHDSANQLQALVRIVLEGLGAKQCHLIAHSKGGSDSRAIFMLPVLECETGFVPAGDTRRDTLLRHYEILSLTTIGTPNKGTPSANLGVNTRWSADSAAVSGDSSLDLAMDADVITIQFMQRPKWAIFAGFGPGAGGVGPQGEALSDQVVGSPILSLLNDAGSVGTLAHYTDNHVYSIVGDADLDADQRISFDEGLDFLPLGLPQSSAGQLLNYFVSSLDSDYQLVGKVGTIDALVVGSSRDPVFISLSPHPFDASFANLIWPNDLVTPLWSGIAPGARILRLNSADPNGVPFQERGNLPAEFTGKLSGGNHSLLHRGQAAGLILQQIEADYPIEEPQ